MVLPGRPDRRASTPDLAVIVDTAARMFYDRGYQNTTMQDLSHALGIAKPTLYAHAKGKMEILGLIFARVADEMDAVVTEAVVAEDPVQGLSHVVQGLTHLAVSHGTHYGVFQGDMRELPQPVRRKYLAWSRTFVDALRDLVLRGQMSGALRPDLDPLVVAYAIIGMTNWTARWLRPRGPLPVETVAQHFTELTLHGLSASATVS